MRRARFFVRQPIGVGQTLSLPQFAADHAVRVLRMRDGDAITLFNGDGHDYSGRLACVGKGNVGVQVDIQESVNVESPLAVTLVQAIVRGEKMDWILQKATELGAVRIVPVTSERSEVKLGEERADKRHSRWLHVIQSACEQCGRSRVPVLAMPQSLAQYASALPAAADADLRLCLHPEAAFGLSQLAVPTTATIAIGPEGGFSDRDLSILDQVGFTRLRLGPRVLRTETAGTVAMAALQARFGDMS
ncbi:MAG: 16S rRNA (uracil(1498)-N(3))-methyltransferase [Pseudomonadota bacterium]|nr:16S rRNA (uracil(1498)-N(3))-methyltransferase [Pseudomonadota bacterium]